MNRKVAIVMGSKSDEEIMKNAGETLKEFGIEYEQFIISAHRNPEKTAEFSKSARDKGFFAIIAGAGYAAHLAGVIASHTTLPILAVPLDSSPLKGVDSLYAMVMMPSGIPVAVFTVGKAGAKNAAIFAIEMLAVNDEGIALKLKEMRDGWNKN